VLDLYVRILDGDPLGEHQDRTEVATSRQPRSTVCECRSPARGEGRKAVSGYYAHVRAARACADLSGIIQRSRVICQPQRNLIPVSGAFFAPSRPTRSCWVRSRRNPVAGVVRPCAPVREHLWAPRASNGQLPGCRLTRYRRSGRA
jgi:hypothetical protein